MIRGVPAVRVWAALSVLGAWVLCSVPACSSDEADAIRRAKLAEGCALNSDCTKPLVCAFRSCHIECQDQRDCPAGQLCVPSDQPFKVCLLPEERDCETDNDCPPKLVCWNDGTCRLECIGDSDCIPDQKCVSGVCAVTAELVDGGIPLGDGGDASAIEKKCVYNSDCDEPLHCVGGYCRPQCFKDQDCPLGQACQNQVCTPSGLPDGGSDGGSDAGPTIPLCQNGVQDPSEKGVDCGGSCGGCPGDACTKPSECASLVCTQKKCGAPSCSDGIQNGTESDVDCGGACPKCAPLKGCWSVADCTTGSCVAGSCSAPACTDGQKNGAETDLDCGGSECAACGDGKACDGNSDCQSGNCVQKKCVKAGPAPWARVNASNAVTDPLFARDLDGDVLFGVTLQGTMDFGNGPVASSSGSDVAIVKMKASGAAGWARVLVGSGTDDLRGIATDSQGDVFVLMSGSPTMQLGGATVACDAGTNPSKSFALAKYKRADGAHVFSRCISGLTTLRAGALAVDGNGDLVVSGFVQGTADFGGQVKNVAQLAPFVAKYGGANGALVWVNTFPVVVAGGGDVYSAAAAGSDTYFAGRYWGAYTFGTTTLNPGNSTYEALVVRVDANGGAVWAKSFGTGSDERISSVAVDGTSSVVVGGYFGAQMDLGGTLLPSQGGRDGFVARLKQADGGTEWAKAIGSSTSDEVVSVAVASNGEIAITGFSSAGVNLGGGTLPYAGNVEGFFGRWSAQGNHIASKSWGTLHSDFGSAVGYAGTALVLFGTYGSGIVDIGSGQLPTAGGVFLTLLP